jgi:lipopolysaccharide transport system ATP-binding protein
MSSDLPRVEAADVWKSFRFYRRPIDRFAAWVTGNRVGTPTTFDALRGVSFALATGSSTGIVGVNGAGKSTLLKVLTGTLEPTRGTVRLSGRVASLLELGTGFHPLFTGRQNIFYNARFLGLTDDEIRARLPEIEAFSELEEFLDRPLRTYSSGMQVRLAFAVAASVSPDVLIIDEVLAVGDVYFQQKCMQRIRAFRDAGVTILFVSHDPGAVKTLCDRALLLHGGQVVDDGPPADVLERYNGIIARKAAESGYLSLEATRRPRPRRSGTFEAVISELELLDEHGRPSRALLAGRPATARVRVFFFEAVEAPTVGILIRDRLGNDVYGTNTYHQGVATGSWGPGDTLEVRWDFELELGAGEYALTAAVHSLGVHIFHSYDWLERGLVFQVLPADDRRNIGVARLVPRITTGRGPRSDSAPAVLRQVVGQLPSTIVMDEDDGALLRTGWYGVEGAGRDAFRWTEGECKFLLAVDGPRLCLEVAADRPPGAAPVAVTLLSLDREIGCAQVAPSGVWQVVALPIPESFPRGPAHLRLLVGDVWRPADAGYGVDTRSLGIRVRRIWCEEPDSASR